MSVRLVGCVCAAVLPLLSFPASERVESLIAKMTFEEKVGQLCQYNTKQHGFFFASSDATQASLPEEFLAKIRRGEVGGLISAPGLENYNVLQRAAMESRLKIPLIVGHDVIHGVEVYYPAPFPETCSWDSDLMRRTAERTAPRALRKGVNWTFAPMIDISRDSRWGRIVEGIGEDPFIGALAAAARVKGFQGERLSDGLHIAACAKHYVGYGAVQGGLDYDAVEMSDSTLRNVYLVPFRAAVDAGVATVMSGYHIYNGVHCSANRYLLTDVLRRDLGFGGFVISDYWSVGNLYDCGFAREGDDECAAMTAIRSGIDMEMTGFCYPKGIGKALASGKLKMEEVDEAVRRILVTKERLGLFERPYLDRARLDTAIDDASDLELAREAAEKSVVLLKNRKGTLPLDKGRKIVLIGDIADMPAEMGSSWINLAGSVKGIASLKEGLAKVGQSFEYERCYALTGAVDVAAVERAIARADVVVATFGAYRDESGENRSRADISLSAGQREVIRAIEKSGKTFVAVVFNGRPMVLSELASAADALVEGWQLGSCAGWGVARVLTGEAEPYGRLTATFPNASGECPTYYGRVIGGKSWIPGGDRRKENMWRGHYRDTKMEPVFPFGFGLAYTDFAYSNETARICGDELVCSADVVNTGARRGTEVVQVYIRREISPIASPRRELKGFRRVWLEPGERKTVEIRIPLRSLDYYVEGPKPHVAQGPLSVYIAPDASRGKRLGVVLPEVRADVTAASLNDSMARISAGGGGRVRVLPGRWRLEGPLVLRSNVELNLSDGAELVFTDDPKAYLPAVRVAWEGVECHNYSPLVYAYGQTNVSITGFGTLRAEHAFWYSWNWANAETKKALDRLVYEWPVKGVPVEDRDMTQVPFCHLRPQFLHFNRCRNVRLEDVRIRDSPFWCIHTFACDGVTVRNVDVCSHIHNSDGIDLEMTKNALVEGCTFCQGDDAICVKAGKNVDGRKVGIASENIEIRNCEVKAGHQLLAIGSEVSAGIRNVHLHDCRMSGSVFNALFVKTNSERGGFVENIRMERVQAEHLEGALVAISADTSYGQSNPNAEIARTRIRDIRVSDVHAREAERRLNLRGDPAARVQGVVIRNATVEGPCLRSDIVENVDGLVDEKRP